MKSKNNSPINKYNDKQYILDGYFENLPELCSQCYQVKDFVLK